MEQSQEIFLLKLKKLAAEQKQLEEHRFLPQWFAPLNLFVATHSFWLIFWLSFAISLGIFLGNFTAFHQWGKGMI